MDTRHPSDRAVTEPSALELESYAQWLVRLRWVAVAGVVVSAVLARYVFSAICRRPFGVLLGCALAMIAYNAWFGLSARKGPRGSGSVLVQILLDVVTLTLMLYVTGGIENPFHLLYMFNIVIAAILLWRGAAYLLSAISCVFLVGVTLLQMTDIAPAFPLWPKTLRYGTTHEPGTWMHASGEMIAFVVMAWGTAYLATTIVARLRAREREAAAAREELARERAQSELQLVRAAKVATAGELAAHVAHEVNNPIAIVSAKARLLLSDRRSEMSAPIAVDLEKIVEQADRVARIAQGLLSSCRPSAGVRAAIDLRVPMRKTLSLVEPRARSRNVMVDDLCGGEPLPVLASEIEMEQVFLNLYMNALDAMPQGGRLRVMGSTAPGPCVEGIVEDSGGGIPEEARGRLFEPFVTTRGGSGGSGLGLWISRGIVRAHGGDVHAADGLGDGARFVVRLPANVPVTEARHAQV